MAQPMKLSWTTLLLGWHAQEATALIFLAIAELAHRYQLADIIGPEAQLSVRVLFVSLRSFQLDQN